MKYSEDALDSEMGLRGTMEFGSETDRVKEFAMDQPLVVVLPG